MKRDILSKLIDWKNKENRKPLIVNGVRQCGKTYVLNKFGDTCYNEKAYFNFERDDSLSAIFENDYDTGRIIFELGLVLGKTIKPNSTLIIFDEIQECGRALTSLKYFCEEAPEYNIVCAGSLLGIHLKTTSFPVGKVDLITMYPMSFCEFVRANGEDMLADFIENYSKGTKIPESVGNKYANLLKQYYVVGGMPEAVRTWCDTHDIEKVENIQQTIIDSYEYDFAKHAPIKEFPKLTAIWKSIPEQLAKPNSKFIFSHVKKGWRAKDLEDALEWLINAGLVYKVCKIEKPFMPLSSYKDDTSFKVYLADVGILRKLSRLPFQVIVDSSPVYTEFKGALTENFVLNEMTKSMDEDAYYWTSNNSAEVDFVIQCGMNIVPVEVKAERNVKARSLAEYRKKYEPEYAVKASMKNDTNGKGVLNVPLYLISKIKSFI